MIFTSPFHYPVLFPEVINKLKVKGGKKYIDATIGGGGYAIEILKRGGVVLGIDADQEAVNYIKRKFKVQSGCPSGKFKVNKDLFLEQGNFANLKTIASKYGFDKVAGVIFDLGVSNFLLTYSGRGFSWRKNEPLDMRMDKRGEITAADIINKSSEKELYEIFTRFSEELHSRRIAQAILSTRSLKGPILTTGELVEVVGQALKDQKNLGGTLARIFQALRISVNSELENLKKGLSGSIELLEPKGRLLVLSYHSLEDRIVKMKLRKEERKGILRVITRVPIRAGADELKNNPSAKSAKLRIAEKLS